MPADSSHAFPFSNVITVYEQSMMVVINHKVYFVSFPHHLEILEIFSHIQRITTLSEKSRLFVLLSLLLIRNRSLLLFLMFLYYPFN